MEITRGLVKTSAGHLHYREAGAGEPLILLHINQQSSALMEPLLGVVSRRRRAIALDYPSYGMSDHIPGQPTISDYAGYVTEVMDALGVGRAACMGEAVGAAVTTELAGRYPERISRVVLVNCPFYFDVDEAEDSHAPLKQHLRPADATGFPTTRTLDFVLEHDPDHAPLHPTQDWMDRINLAQIQAGRDRWQALNALAKFDIANALSRIPCPALLLFGEHFPYAKLHAEFTKRVADLRIKTFKLGRFGLTWEHAERVGKETLDFLKKG